MGWIIGTLTIWLIAAGCALLLPVFYEEKYEYDQQGRGQKARRYLVSKSTAWLLSLGVAGVFWVILTLFSSVHFVSSGELGVVRTFSKITSQVEEGVQWTWPWQSVETWNIRTQVLVPDETCINGTENCMNAGSVDVQDVYVSGQLNFSVSPQAVQQLARTVGTRYRETIVLNRLKQVTKETIATFKAENILQEREAIRATIRDRMVEEMAEFSITVTDFLITNIDFTPEFKDAIEAKVIAEQDALRERNRVEIAKAQADQAEAEAEGRARALVAEAQGQAEANRLIAESLTAELIQFQAVQKLTENVQIALIPAGEGVIIDPTTLLR